MRTFLFVGCCLLLVSCFDQGDCLFSNTTFLKVKILDKDTVSQAERVLFNDVFTPGGFTYLNDSTTSFFVLAVDPTKTEMKYVFQYEGRSDTLLLGYTNQTIVLSPDCGSYIFQNDLEIKHTTFERIRIVNSRLLRSAETNIEILL